MAEEERHPNKRSTGTVPKQRNNYNRPFNEVERLRSFSNSSSDCYPSRDSSNEVKNPRRSNKIKDLIVESTLENQNFSTQIGYSTLNSIGSSNPSSPTSQRNATTSTLKCDNITKCPNKKQIEDKLNQIHEYLKVTNSLMASMKKTDDQIPGRGDDFPVDNAFSGRKNEENANLGYNLGFLKDCQQMGYPLRRKSENKRSSPGQNQSNLLLEVCNDVHSSSNKDIRNYVEFDTPLKDRSEKTKKTIHPHPHILSNQDKGLANVDSLHNHIISMHNSNDENERLLETLDGTDSELASEHAELHKKLIELQNRKFQIDRLVAQLQSFGDTYEDTDNQFKKICAMKEQLNKLKDMLEVVKMPDNILQNTNNPYDDGKTSCYLCAPAEQFREKDVKKAKLKSRIHNDSNVFRNANASRDGRPKQMNTNSRERGNQVNKANMSSIAQKIALQNELECKKRELEEIMGKHKGNASNLNQDIGIDTKSEISSITNGLNEPWTSIISQESDSERFSSDDSRDAVNNYSELKHNFLSLPSLNYSPSGVANPQSENSQRGNYVQPTEYQPMNGLPYASDIHFRSNSVGATGRFKKTRRSNSEEINSNQMQKQLQMIRSMCDTFLKQQTNEENPTSMPQLRNNLISSPQRFLPTTQPHRVNSDNMPNANSEAPPQWFPSNMCNNAPNDGYYNWLTNNTIQTQSFMLNTLNQCYQMLWMQQRELALLKNNMSMLQERLKHCNIGPANSYSPAPVQTNSQLSPNRRLHQPEVDRKMNQDAGFAIPMADQFDCSLQNMPLNCLNNNSQLLESCLNNINVNRLNVHHNPTESSIPPHSVPNHMWSGQALNNQVVPGNRANNYWDNFRSYSRQNLLSTKNSEVLQNLPSVIDRSNFVNQCVNPFAFISFSKSNSEQDSTSTSQENTPQRTTTKDVGPENSLGALPRGAHSDIMNNSMRNCDTTEAPAKDVYHKDNTDVYFGLPSHASASNEALLNQSNHVENPNLEEPKRQDEDRIESTTDHPQSTQFDDIRESVYKEVASLISANENRPQFLIQLFRDLQMIQSDNGRFNILQSIERNVAETSPQMQDLRQKVIKTQKYSVIAPPSIDSGIAAPSSNASSNNEFAISGTLLHKIEILLDRYNETVIQKQFAGTLKRLLLGLECLKDSNSTETPFHHNLESFLNRELERHYGQRLADVKVRLLIKIEDFLLEQLGIEPFIDEISSTTNDREREPENSVNPVRASDGDLAEADQSGIVAEDSVEEGAVGGILDAVPQPRTLDIPENLDAVIYPPPQLRSRSVTPTRDQSIEDTELLQL